MNRYCIFNGDDFGFSIGINRGILAAHHGGVLKSTSLMVDLPAAGEAAELMSKAPGMSVGLHVVLTREDCTPLLDFSSREACAAEIARQWDRAVEILGTLPSHLDAHHNIYRDPRLLPLFKEWAAVNHVPLREHSFVRYVPEFYGQWDGETHLEQIGVDSLSSILRARVGEGITEIGCHPGYIDADFQSAYSIERETELQTLCSPKIREVIDALGITLISYRESSAINAHQKGMA